MNNKAKWTPGPWFACIPEEVGETVCYINKNWAVHCDETVEVNGFHDAHLIAAAPELYEALADALKKYGDRDMHCTDYDMYADALSKARGEQ